VILTSWAQSSFALCALRFKKKIADPSVPLGFPVCRIRFVRDAKRFGRFYPRFGEQFLFRAAKYFGSEFVEERRN